MVPTLKLPAQISVVCTSIVPPLLVKGRCVGQEGDHLLLELPAGNDLPAGASLIVDFAVDVGITRAIVAPAGTAGELSRVKVLKMPAPDKREYPRQYGGIKLNYHVVPSEDAVSTWLGGGAEVGPVSEPDPFMNFSVTGLAFDDTETCKDNDLIAFTITVPGAAHTWRGAAKVVRVARIPIDERDEAINATHRIAVYFTDLPDDARVALQKHTERIQEAYL